MKTVARYEGGFRWEGIPVHAYKEDDERFREVTRQLLFGSDAGLACDLRYFEIDPDGHSTLERHHHSHAVVVVRGRGHVFVDAEIRDIVPFDLVHVPSMVWHQFRASVDTPLGFLCIANADRDRPIRPTKAELEKLRRSEEVAAFIRV